MKSWADLIRSSAVRQRSVAGFVLGVSRASLAVSTQAHNQPQEKVQPL